MSGQKHVIFFSNKIENRATSLAKKRLVIHEKGNRASVFLSNKCNHIGKTMILLPCEKDFLM